MTNFAKRWLAAPESVKALFVPDDRQEWVCPECLAVQASGKMRHGKIISSPHWHTCKRVEQKWKIIQPIPRLDQLIEIAFKGIVSYYIIMRLMGIMNEAYPLWYSTEGRIQFPTWERLILAYICLENGHFKLNESDNWIKE